MFEQMLSIKPAKLGPPGSNTLLVGTTQLGYYPMVPATDLITGSALATAVGLTAGTLINDTIDWFKFAYKGAILFVPQKPVRYGMSYGALDAMGVVAGKTITIKGHTYKVRLMKGASANPYTGPNDASDPANTAGSEYNDLIYRVCATNPPSETAPSFATFTQDQLGCNGNGGNQWCQEASKATGVTNGIVTRGNTTGDFATLSSPPSGQTDQYRGWRPVLEFIS